MGVLPTHIAIIPDGNRRWAEKKGLSRFQGHQAGAERMFRVVNLMSELGIKYLTIWGFSSDNWKRQDEEVQSIFHLLALWMKKNTQWAHSKGIRLRHIGRLQGIPDELLDLMVIATDLTKDNLGLTLNVAFNYSGRAEIVDAVQRLINEVGMLQEPTVVRLQLNEQLLNRYLYTSGMPDVDLVIRTAGEYRMSNFMLWQTAYSEYYFTDVFWPDFDEKELERALKTYGERKRRYGGD